MPIMSKEQSENFKLIKAMHTVVMALNDEDAIEPWFYSYPDRADDEELMDIAGDYELMDDLCSNFRCRMASGAKHGWVTKPIDGLIEKSSKIYVYGAKV